MTDIFTIHKFNIKVEALNEPIYIVPFGDVHRFAPLCDVEKWHEFLEWAKNKKRIYFLGMGDYDDLASFNERKILGSDNLHESTLQSLEDIYSKRTKDFAKELSFMQGKIIGIIEGNHYAKFQNGTTSTQYLCQLLKCKYLGVSSFVRLSFQDNNRYSVIDIWLHHGKSASSLVGGSLNSVEQMSQIADADIYLMGHDHKKSVALKTRLTLKGNNNINLHQKKILLARTGSFLKGYVPEKPSYIAKALLNPTDLGTIKIELTPKRNRKNKEDNFYIDIHASI